MNVLVTGSNGFVGNNLITALNRIESIMLFKYDVNGAADQLNKYLKVSDVIYHLAGVNRPSNTEDFYKGNTEFTEMLCRKLIELGRSPKIIFTSTIQAELDNPYGRSKLEAERIIKKYTEQTNAIGVVYRLKNLFGKWCRPNYNSVTATFCYNIAHNLPIQISNPTNKLELTYIDDVIAALIDELKIETKNNSFILAGPIYSQEITLGELSEIIESFKKQRDNLILPDFSNRFVRALYTTYLSYLDDDNFGYLLNGKLDNRGYLAEFIKGTHFGQVFVSRTKPGVTRGNHYHHTKTEKFLVVQGNAIVRFRNIRDGKVIEYSVQGDKFKVIDIPPGFAHSIENIGQDELVTIFWASEIFEQKHPDTYISPVLE